MASPLPPLSHRRAQVSLTISPISPRGRASSPCGTPMSLTTPTVAMATLAHKRHVNLLNDKTITALRASSSFSIVVPPVSHQQHHHHHHHHGHHKHGHSHTPRSPRGQKLILPPQTIRKVYLTEKEFTHLYDEARGDVYGPPERPEIGMNYEGVTNDDIILIL